MLLVLVRLASQGGEGLSHRGNHQATVLAEGLADRGVRPSVYLSSQEPAAVATCGLLAKRLHVDGESAVCETSRALTPRAGSPGRFSDVLDDADRARVDIASRGVVMLIGHEGRLSNLLTELTGRRFAPIANAGCAGVRAADVGAFRRGEGTLEFRLPMVDHQEAALRGKAHSKLAVASLLAGFVLTALIEVLTRENRAAEHDVATIALTAALGLFVAAIYIYDQLAMPEGFWTDGGRSPLARRVARFRAKRHEQRWKRVADKDGAAVADDTVDAALLDGPLFTELLRTWRWVFSPAVLCALIGLGAVVWSVESMWVRWLCLSAVALAGVVYLVLRPDLGPD